MKTLPLDQEDYWQDIYGAITQAQEVDDFASTPDGGIYAIRVESVEGVLKNRDFGAADLLAMMGLDSGPVWEWWSRLMFSNDDPFHGRIRRLVSRAFTRGRIEKERQRINALAKDLYEIEREKGTSDVMEGIAHHLPSRVMAELFRIPESDRDVFCEWTSDIGLAFGAATDPAVRTRVEHALASLDSYCSELVEHRRRNPGDDLLSELVAVEEKGDSLTQQELVDLIENLLFAGHDTTRGTLGVMFWVLHSNRETLRRLREDPSLIPNAVEELLRFEAITYSTARTALRDTTVAGRSVPEGTVMGVCLPAASRDDRVYPDPHVFDITRQDIHPPTFGAGAHFCIGASLARAELQEAMLLLITMFDDFQIDAQPRWTPFAHIRRYDSAVVEFS